MGETAHEHNRRIRVEHGHAPLVQHFPEQGGIKQTEHVGERLIGETRVGAQPRHHGIAEALNQLRVILDPPLNLGELTFDLGEIRLCRRLEARGERVVLLLKLLAHRRFELGNEALGHFAKTLQLFARRVEPTDLLG